MNTKLISLISTAFVLSACGSDEGAPCTTAQECSADSVCVAHGSSAACTPLCSVSANECGGTAQCAGVGALEVNVCQEPPSPNAETPPSAEEAPRIPCQTDAECGSLAVGAVCAQFQGRRDCTILCNTEPQCDPPSLGGIKMDFMTCIVDEGDASRTACLPDAKCFNDPISCIQGLDQWGVPPSGSVPGSGDGFGDDPFGG